MEHKIQLNEKIVKSQDEPIRKHPMIERSQRVINGNAGTFWSDLNTMYCNVKGGQNSKETGLKNKEIGNRNN